MYKHAFLWYNASINRVNASINSQFYLGLLSTSFSYRYPQLLLPLPGHITVTESDGSVPLLHHHRIATVIGQSVAEMAWIGLLSELLLFFGLLQGFADGAQASPAEMTTSTANVPQTPTIIGIEDDLMLKSVMVPTLLSFSASCCGCVFSDWDSTGRAEVWLAMGVSLVRLRGVVEVEPGDPSGKVDVGSGDGKSIPLSASAASLTSGIDGGGK